jgi:hypothetical protein
VYSRALYTTIHPFSGQGKKIVIYSLAFVRITRPGKRGLRKIGDKM